MWSAQWTVQCSGLVMALLVSHIVYKQAQQPLVHSISSTTRFVQQYRLQFPSRSQEIKGSLTKRGRPHPSLPGFGNGNQYSQNFMKQFRTGAQVHICSI